MMDFSFIFFIATFGIFLVYRMTIGLKWTKDRMKDPFEIGPEEIESRLETINEEEEKEEDGELQKEYLSLRDEFSNVLARNRRLESLLKPSEDKVTILLQLAEELRQELSAKTEELKTLKEENFQQIWNYHQAMEDLDEEYLRGQAIQKRKYKDVILEIEALRAHLKESQQRQELAHDQTLKNVQAAYLLTIGNVEREKRILHTHCNELQREKKEQTDRIKKLELSVEALTAELYKVKGVGKSIRFEWF